MLRLSSLFSRAVVLHEPDAQVTPASEAPLDTSSNVAAADLAAAAPLPRPRPALIVGVTDLDQAVVVTVAGDAGTDNLHELELVLARLVARRVPLAVFDCSALTLLSSLAMGMLVGLRRDLGRWQGCVKLACLGPRTEEALRVTRLSELFQIHATIEQALASAASR
jgi:anti-sigma B factor antagonist